MKSEIEAESLLHSFGLFSSYKMYQRMACWKISYTASQSGCLFLSSLSFHNLAIMQSPSMCIGGPALAKEGISDLRPKESPEPEAACSKLLAAMYNTIYNVLSRRVEAC